MSMHFRDVKGVARCLVVDLGVSTSGIIGEPWSCSCDCVEFVSQRAIRNEEKEAERRAEFDHSVGQLMESVRWRCGAFDWVI
jgi:hypothetical protein